MEKILIPATLDTKLMVRAFTCYDHQIRFRGLNTESYYHNITLNDNRFRDHGQVIQAILKWQSTEEGRRFVVFAYQVIRMTFIMDDRSEWRHENHSSSLDKAILTKKVFVYDNPDTKIITFSDLDGDIAWAKRQLEIQPPSSRDGEGFDRRGISAYTAYEYDRLKESGVEPDAQFLKLGATTFVPVSEAIEFRPDDRVNQLYRAENQVG
jgi:hypothetical protein